MKSLGKQSLPPSTEARLQAILAELDARDWTIALAESCTGGLISTVFSGMEGLSHVFVCGFVTYSDDAKREALGVSSKILNGPGAVSCEAAAAMAEGALARSSADIAVSVTGFAGPAGPSDEEGLVYLGVASREGPVSARQVRFGPIGREAIRLSCLRCVLDLLEIELGITRPQIPMNSRPMEGTGHAERRQVEIH